MRKTTRSGSFFLVYCLNAVLNIRLTIPGWILLILHFITPQYIRWWYGAVYLVAYLLYILIWMLILRALGRWVNTARPAPPIENKNPYSLYPTERTQDGRSITPARTAIPILCSKTRRSRQEKAKNNRSTGTAYGTGS